MSTEQNQPKEFDAVRGEEVASPLDGSVLGGIQGVKRRLTNSHSDVKIAALNDAIKYGDIGLDLVIDALQDSSQQVQLVAAKLLQQNGGEKAQKALLTFSKLDIISPKNIALRRVLDKILTILEERVPDIASALQPGLTREEIDKITKDFPLKLPEEVYELYQWRNGISGYVGFGLTWNGIQGGFSPLAEAIEDFYNVKQRGCPSNFLRLFLFIHYLGGDYFAVSLDNATYPIIHFTEDNEITIQNFLGLQRFSPSLTTLLYAIVECFQVNAIYISTPSNDDSSLEFNYDKVRNIIRKYNTSNLKIYNS
ncbi:hypothetical protein DSM106972_047980 [Dulcicalothrix desertica PCC 7102]|uniref:Knr4/Smi1-like domain-containing protein n=1 Tax=Dulcicalothrix desertica PCC 7102 TaxID=232991 RepID=A0A3S1D5H3_9CYAN|nr:SMI1/KNR4 family protein [Dulcicalothrix desertica]RUT03884.1 hypothetical protein DSM106972_047980 [Dulcicalothrix desertica PCC 7102]TWH43705.1 SMI1/KNR4 family protein SUKH-1 [Dulcicalothrix desertica PCC 7102]